MSEQPKRWREAEVLTQVGVPQKALRVIRRDHLQKGTDYDRDAGGYWFTDAAVAKVRRLARGEELPKLSNVTATPLPKPKRETADMRITRLWPGRDKMVLCETPNGLEAVVKVQSTRNLTNGMVLKACIRGEFRDWFYNGPLPRRRGKL